MKKQSASDNEEAQLVAIIGDFLELGHVENIMAMFKQDTSLYALTDKLLRDQRYMVRMGMAVLFEEMKVLRPKEVVLAIPSLAPLLEDETPWVRGEAATLLGTIGTDEALALLIPMQNDPDPQVREIITDYLGSPA